MRVPFSLAAGVLGREAPLLKYSMGEGKGDSGMMPEGPPQ